ncbi:hypothetical protein CAG54_02265 [Vibrio sp. V27_P1S3P104]|uniref:hypothetical protein n=1 Tax=Vibrio TaxID=662 RepID=UPI000C17199B|nr:MULTISPECIES: hypothetical protein [Vibrio]NAW67998.1 hypothetical protein [Vibrio sp. V28_P6S34P95]NAX04900.1 hypothetical protein [Vibrio sp. V30_P3S12P165]NAX34385.1 hypothetical protein [Vibrio sp. V29_P1S30P107]NAX36347.1 hypothetical protein [Vibrio sp. V27_P1S3P104]NAX40315.1 hypothetical protein [Vibrio sp. V26_P1S5P106]
MKRSIVTLLLAAASSMTATAADNQCLAQKYDAYIDASLAWYQDLATITAEKYPDLADVSQWFLTGRQHHFELNRTAVRYYLQHQPEKVATSQPIESWLKLEQQEIKQLATRDDELGLSAKTTFDDRQNKPHEKNYQLRSAFAELLSHPKQIEPVLNRYNQAIAKAERIHCL